LYQELRGDRGPDRRIVIAGNYDALNEEMPDVRARKGAWGVLTQRVSKGRGAVLLHGVPPRLPEEPSARNIAKYRAAASVRNEVRRAAIRRIIRQAKDRPCSDCGSRYPPYVMDFDHRDRKNKRFNIGRDALIGLIPDAALLEEINKCDVVCSNCHRMRTHQ
jgi:hypothetical protein